MTAVTPGPGPGVVTAAPGDVEVLSQVIADAFFALPPSRWLIADPAARRQVFPSYFRIYVEHAITTGIVHTTPGRTAAALWLPVSAAGPAPPPGYDPLLAAATGPWAGRFRDFDATLDRHHPTGTAHWHLAILAVRPGCQGHGTGSLLLHAHHTALDHDGTPAYLEAATVRTRRLYTRHGYALRPDAPIRLPGSGPLMWPMVRQPRPASHASTAASTGAPGRRLTHEPPARADDAHSRCDPDQRFP
jgi:GNAT superfamily N-acetyltransferase